MAENLEATLSEILERNRAALQKGIAERRGDVVGETDHFELYELLALPAQEVKNIDFYQTMSRLAYRHAEALLRELSAAVLRQAKGAKPITIENVISDNPKAFDVDAYVEADKRAHEIQWRVPTTNGEQVRREHARIHCILDAGMKPVKVVYYVPNRVDARRVQDRLVEIYRRHAEIHVGQDAWDYMRDYTGFDLHRFLQANQMGRK